jgi:5-(carboxyamino)imidazole ribonucleotide mutase
MARAQDFSRIDYKRLRKGYPPHNLYVCVPAVHIFPMATRQSARRRGAPAPLVGVIMGSKSDYPQMAPACAMLGEFGIPFEAQIVSAHRTPDWLFEYAAGAESRGLRVIIAGAGGAAHLPGMVATKTLLPVLGVPVETKILQGLDSLLSILQMPKGVPVGTLAIGAGGAANAALLAARILALGDPALRRKLDSWRKGQRDAVRKQKLPGRG